MKKTVLFAFNGDPVCFVHVLLNALDMHDQGQHVQIVIEGAATQLLPALAQASHPLHQLWGKAQTAGLVAGVCKACATKLATIQAAREQQLPLMSEMSGHPSMARFQDAGYNIISF